MVSSVQPSAAGNIAASVPQASSSESSVTVCLSLPSNLQPSVEHLKIRITSVVMSHISSCALCTEFRSLNSYSYRVSSNLEARLLRLRSISQQYLAAFNLSQQYLAVSRSLNLAASISQSFAAVSRRSNISPPQSLAVFCSVSRSISQSNLTAVLRPRGVSQRSARSSLLAACSSISKPWAVI